MSNIYANSREMICLWDSTKANPNGDMLNENKPRLDETTGLLETSDFRIKRFARDEMDANGIDILVKTVFDEKGNVKTCSKRVDDIKKEKNIKKDEELIDYIMTNYLDARLFGCVITKPKKNFTGPVQITWSRSLNEGVIELKKGTGAYASDEGKKASTTWESYICQYALFNTYIAYNKNTAINNGYSITEEDIETFKNSLLNGMRNFRSTSKNQMPRVLLEVVYKENNLDGELDVLEVIKDVDDTELRSISQTKVNLEKLNNYYNLKKDKIEKVNIYVHSNVNLLNIDESLGFNIITI